MTTLTHLPNGLYVVNRTPAERAAAFTPTAATIRACFGARTESCLTCDEPFVPVPRHPMVEQAHCDACLAILRPLWWDMVHAEMQPAGEPMLAMTAEEV